MAVEANVTGWIAVGFVSDARTLSGDADVVYLSLPPGSLGGELQQAKLTGFGFADRNTPHSLPTPLSPKSAQLLNASTVVVTSGRNGLGNDGVYSTFVFTRPLESVNGGVAIDPRNATGVLWATNFYTPPLNNNGVYSYGPHSGAFGTRGWWTVLLDDTPPTVPTCEYYCATTASVCGLGFQVPSSQYTDYGQCLSLCSDLLSTGVWSTGTPDDTSQNTLQCRVGAASTVRAASANDELARRQNCGRAGPSGGDFCGRWCDNYCSRAVALCNATANAAALRNATACRHACAVLADDARFVPEPQPPDPRLASPSFPFYNTVQCRIARSLASATCVSDFSPEACQTIPTAGEFCTVPCGGLAAPNCSDYCAAVAANCGGPYDPFAGGDCLSWCRSAVDSPSAPGGFRVGNLWDLSGNSLGCRINVANTAESSGRCLESRLGRNVCTDASPGPPPSPSPPSPPPPDASSDGGSGWISLSKYTSTLYIVGFVVAIVGIALGIVIAWAIVRYVKNERFKNFILQSKKYMEMPTTMTYDDL